MSFSPYTHKVLVRCERQTCHRTGELASGHNWHEASRHSAAPYPRRADGVAPWAWPCGLRVIGVAAGRVGNYPLAAPLAAAALAAAALAALASVC